MKNLFQPIIAGSLDHDPVSRHPLVQPVKQELEQAVEQAAEQALILEEKKLPNRERAHLRLKFS